MGFTKNQLIVGGLPKKGDWDRFKGEGGLTKKMGWCF